ncbi:MAG: MoaD/ThiS family protein [Chloroflexi bacterium]|nr:MoaD/ThiS family protein [Chloroflexota bacterium]
MYATLRQSVGAKSVRLDNADLQTVGDALRALTARYPRLAPSIWHDDGTLAGHVAVVLDGRDIRHLDGLATPLGDAELGSGTRILNSGAAQCASSSPL